MVIHLPDLPLWAISLICVGQRVETFASTDDCLESFASTGGCLELLASKGDVFASADNFVTSKGD